MKSCLAATVKTCLIKAGFNKTESEILQDFNPEDKLPLSLLPGLMRHLKVGKFHPEITVLSMNSDDDELEEALTILPDASLIKSYDDVFNAIFFFPTFLKPIFNIVLFNTFF